jgi:RNA polymerase sigma-70 factor (ECF subfamily)
MDDQDLIRRAADGDRSAFALLVERKRERVLRIAWSVLGDRELAKDVAQEVFLRLYLVLRRFRSGRPFDAWLYRITLNLSIDARRRERPHREAMPLEGTEPGAGAGAGQGVPGGAGQGSPAGASLRLREVRRIFVELSARLGRKQRAAFILREIEGLSTAEVAEIMKTTESTVRNHILQARRILQEELRRRYPEYCRPGR